MFEEAPKRVLFSCLKNISIILLVFYTIPAISAYTIYNNKTTGDKMAKKVKNPEFEAFKDALAASKIHPSWKNKLCQMWQSKLIFTLDDAVAYVSEQLVIIRAEREREIEIEARAEYLREIRNETLGGWSRSPFLSSRAEDALKDGKFIALKSEGLWTEYHHVRFTETGEVTFANFTSNSENADMEKTNFFLSKLA